MTIENVYRSPKNTQADDIYLCNDFEHLVTEVKNNNNDRLTAFDPGQPG